MGEPSKADLRLGVQITLPHVKNVGEESAKMNRSRSGASLVSGSGTPGSGRSAQVPLETDNLHRVFLSGSERENSSGQESSRSHDSSNPANAPRHPPQQQQSRSSSSKVCCDGGSEKSSRKVYSSSSHSTGSSIPSDAPKKLEPEKLQPHYSLPGTGPADPSVRPPNWSKGSELHRLGECSPCAWNHRPNGCSNGADCAFCHMCVQGMVKARRKELTGKLKSEQRFLRTGEHWTGPSYSAMDHAFIAAEKAAGRDPWAVPAPDGYQLPGIAVPADGAEGSLLSTTPAPSQNAPRSVVPGFMVPRPIEVVADRAPVGSRVSL